MIDVVQRDILHIVGQPHGFEIARAGQKILRPGSGKFPMITKTSHNKSSIDV